MRWMRVRVEIENWHWDWNWRLLAVYVVSCRIRTGDTLRAVIV